MSGSAAAAAGRGHAVVIGASVAGLLSARVLSDTFARVTVLDRDVLPASPAARPGVPQGQHAHILLAGGGQVLEDLLPGFWREMTGAGAVPGDMQRDLHWYLDGQLMRPAPSGLIGIGLSQPLIEHLIRARIAALPGVQITGAAEVTGLLTTPGQERVTGVRLRRHQQDAAKQDTAGQDTAELAADLVIDASGRGSAALAWLQELGYPATPATQIRTDAVYVTRHYRRAAHQLDGRQGTWIVPFPGQPRSGVVLAQENDQFAVLLAGLLGDEPPADGAGMLEFAGSLPAPDIADVIRSAQPLDEPVTLRFPASLRHHYEKAGRYLGGFLVTGDALCGLNPVYGQGMTVAALEAAVLRQVLADGPGPDLARQFFPAVGKIVDVAWSLSAAVDLRFPQVEGERPRTDGPLSGHLDRYRAAMAVDPSLGKTFLRVINLVDPPSRMLSPGHLLRVRRSAKKARTLA
jgi:2-polyprenyl-6-methoxyphenol hydroxylase-like FAD-dependent oxidoreductase